MAQVGFETTAIRQIATTERVVNKRNTNRLDNLRRLMADKGGPKALADIVGYETPSYLVQMAGPNPTRPISEATARKIEAACDLAEGSLDWPQFPAPTAPVSVPNGQARGVDPSASARDAQIVQMLATVWSEDRITLPVVKFGQIAAYAISQAADTGKPPTAEALRQLVQLLK